MRNALEESPHTRGIPSGGAPLTDLPLGNVRYLLGPWRWVPATGAWERAWMPRVVAWPSPNARMAPRTKFPMPAAVQVRPRGKDGFPISMYALLPEGGAQVEFVFEQADDVGLAKMWADARLTSRTIPNGSVWRHKDGGVYFAFQIVTLRTEDGWRTGVEYFGVNHPKTLPFWVRTVADFLAAFTRVVETPVETPVGAP